MKNLPKGFALEKVPFITGTDLLEKQKQNPSPEEVAAIAICLIGSKKTPQQVNNPLWATAARLEAISNRL